MFRRNFESILSDCLEAMHHGATVDDCLARYPRQARKLAPQLAMAAQVSRTPMAAARPEAQAQAWRALQKRSDELRSGKARPVVTRAVSGSPAWVKPAAISAVLVVSLSAVGGGAMYAAQDAAPDSGLYRVKLAGEDIRVMFIFDDNHKANVLLDQSQQRMEEINATIREGEPVPENALSAMNDRNQRAEEILAKQPENTTLRARVLSQAAGQEDRLLAIWSQVPPEGRTTYAEAVANLHNMQLSGGGAQVATLRPEELSGGILAISGEAQLGEDGVWRIGGFEVKIDDGTLGYKDVQPGTGASVLAAKSSNGRLHALSATVDASVLPTALVSGAVEQITDKGIVVDGLLIPLSNETLQTAPLKIGDKVQVTVHNTANGLFAGSINQYAATTGGSDETVWFEGTIQGDVSKATSQWTVGGMQFQITASTAIDAWAGSAQNGARVQIEAMNSHGNLLARRVMVITSQARADSATFLGTFDGYDEDAGVWNISGIPVSPPASASPSDDPDEGSLVVVDVQRQGNDLTATSLSVIQPPDGPQLVQLEGTISEIDGSRWTLKDIGQVRVSSTAKVSGAPALGKRVIVWGSQGRDGELEGTFARILDQSPVTTPVPAGAPPTPTPVASTP
jgi:hypothetical protein